ncbi:MAG: HEPN domain-containing protein [bacterium]
MNNFQRGEKLLSQAESISRELTNVFERNLPNLVVRRAQEIVEISLKALFKMMGIEYPKVYDVGSLLEEVIKKRGIKTEGKILEKLKEVSSYLARDRAPSFYFEKDYTLEQARCAKEDALGVLNFGKKITQRIKS